ncbi:MAG: ATP-binding protein [Coleofasciculaceae cyanobacterium]
MNIIPPRDSPLVLIVDDDQFMRIQLRHAMEQSGYQVAQASDGDQAISIYLDRQPDIVLLDAMMPVMDGFACCQLLRTLVNDEQVTSKLPILMITALEDQHSVDQAFAVGATDYVTKPIHWAVLRQRVRRLLEASQTMKALQQQTERARISEKQLLIALEAAQMGTWNWNIQTGKVTHSVITEAIYGLNPGSFEGRYDDFLKSIHPEDREMVSESVRRTFEEKAEYDLEFRIIRPDGVVRWVASKGQVYYSKKVDDKSAASIEYSTNNDLSMSVNAAETQSLPVRMTGINIDITERKHTQEELQRQNRRSQLFAEVTLKIRQSLQIQEILQTTVTEVQRILQCDRVVIFKIGSTGFGKIVTEAVNQNCFSILTQRINDDYFATEYLQKYNQGRIYAVDDIQKAEIPPCLREFMQELEIKAKLAVPILIKAKFWGLLVAHQCTTPRQWSSFEVELLGQLADQIGIALAQAELLEQETHQRLELARSNSELQQFASIASHDLQEPLRKIQTFGNRLKNKYAEALTEQGLDYLERMQNAAERMQILIDDLLSLSRVTTKAQPFVTVNLNQITQEVLSDLEVRIQQCNNCVTVSELPTIDADPVQMRQLLQNLISNALKFHHGEKPQSIKVYSHNLESEANTTGGSSTLEWFQLIVEDNGIGFDEKYLDRIFNVFQRLHTRSEYEGTGMGLAICRKIAERHGGSITRKSTLGQGAKFIVKLPKQQRKGENLE